MQPIESILFLGTLVPENKEFINYAFNRSGNSVQDGICEELSFKTNLEFISFRPIPSFPKSKKIFLKNSIKQYNNFRLILIPFINLIILKTICGIVLTTFYSIKWALRNRNKNKAIIVYNAYTPPIFIVYFLGIITNSKTLIILYDLGIPPKSLKLDLKRRIIYNLVEFFAKIFIPKMNGRIIINDAIKNDYAKGKPCLLIDGGINKITEKKLLNIIKANNKNYVFLVAGSLWEANGIKFIIEGMKKIKNPNIEIYFAGKGVELDYILKSAKEDSRIKYIGNLSFDELITIYNKVDVLLNLRISNNSECKYLFPSKIIEYLATGKYVISTNISHIEKEYGQFCYVLKENDENSLIKAIQETVSKNKDELHSYGEQARQYILRTHTWEIQTNKILEYLIKIN